MEENHKLALFVAYYLARFNDQALSNLGYPNWVYAFRKIAEKLKVNRHSVKNWRDEFDPLFGHRVGWHQRQMTQSRVEVVQLLEDLNEPEIRRVVLGILSGTIATASAATEELKIAATTK